MTAKEPQRSIFPALLGVLGFGLSALFRRMRRKPEGEAAEEALAESRARFRAVFEDAAIGIALWDLEGRLEESNPAFRRMLGYSGEVLLGRVFSGFTYPDDVAAGLGLYEELVAGERDYYQMEKRYVRKDGRLVWGRLTVSLVRDVGGEPRFAVSMVEDITERKGLEERLEHQAFHDSLTGLPNRALFMDRLGHALARVERHKKSPAVLFLDLDDFKLVNDSLGHEVGDQLLVEVAGRLSAGVRPEDTVARLGGDEFTVLLEDVDGTRGASRVAERIARSLQAPFRLGEHQISVSASIGIFIGGAGREEPQDLLRNADLALYGAKRKGKARYEVFEEAMTDRFVERLRMEGDLRRAIERDEFTVFYQPKMLLEDGGIAGVEALVRWEHPDRGLISPSEFIPLAEETGLIISMGYRVLEKACRQTCAWQRRYPGDAPKTVYVNLSARQFDDPELVEELKKVLTRTGMEPGSLALEIAEGVLMRDAESAVVRLRALRSLGVRVVVDDFGTAYSSLSQLGRLPMDFLDIDRSITLKLGANPEDTAIVSAMIQLSHALGWEVTAEGVETADQLARLKALGCDMAQGYYLWSPLSRTQMSAFLQEIAS